MTLQKVSIWPQCHRKRFLLQLMSTVKLTFEKGYDIQIVMYTGTRKPDVSLVRELKNLSHAAINHGVIDQGK